ncbi:MAG: hypothetical protein AB8B64_16815 [Granulosicoccus sp.]
MIYLISQMILALAVAVILGMALGWLVHRTTYNRQTLALKKTMARQRAGLAQTQSEVSMLADDYDEMQRQLQDQIDTLKQENRQIQPLNSNLEKSQLLVKQMMQRHETKLRELTREKESLETKLAKFEEQEQTRNQLAAGLDKRRRESAQNAALLNENKASNDTISPLQDPSVLEDNPQFTSDAEVAMSATEPVSEHGEFKTSKPALFAAAESEADPFDQVMEVADELQRELDLTAERKSAGMEMDMGSSIDLGESEPKPSVEPDLESGNNNTVNLDSTDHNGLNLNTVRLDANERDHSPLDLRDLSQDTDGSEDLDNLIALEDVGDFTDSLDSDAGDTFGQTNDLDELDQTDGTLDQTSDTHSPNSPVENHTTIPIDTEDATIGGVGPDLTAVNDALQLDGSGDEAAPFGPVKQRDDLQQIFGIGPLTEKALNELGITSYSQLAELKHHEIQRIADALEIGPGRIERDNWVGNARRQLEEVLAQL